MRMLSCILAALAAAALFAGGVRADNKIPNKLKEALDKADSFELYSLEPGAPKPMPMPEENTGDLPPGIRIQRSPIDKPKTEDKPTANFHGAKVLGKTTIKDAETRKKLVAALEKGVEENNGIAADCFLPRHGLRVHYLGDTFDLVICFQCLQVRVYADGKKVDGFLVERSPQPVFDKVLKDANVPLPGGPAESLKGDEPLPGFPNIKHNASLLEVPGNGDRPLLKIIKTQLEPGKKEIVWLLEVQTDLTYEDYLAIRKAWQSDSGTTQKGPAAHFFDKDRVKLYKRDLKEIGELRNAKRGDCIRLILEVGDGFANAASMEIRQP